MPNIFKSTAFLIFLFILLSIFYSGCVSDFIVSSTNSEVTKGSIIIENSAEYTKDCTPILAIYSEEAAYMSFGGDGQTWTDWIEYDTFYEEFNIANGLNGTTFGSGTRYIFVRFKDEDGNLSPSDELAFDAIEYEMGELYSIKISPQEVTIPVGGSYLFTLHGYDYGSINEIPIESSIITWTKGCGVGSLSPATGLTTTYTAPPIPGERNITAQYNNLKTGATVIVVSDD